MPFNNVDKVSLVELDDYLQTRIGLIGGMVEDLEGIYPGATKVENLGGGKIKINDVEHTVYSHPGTHPASMITGLARVATSGSYTDLLNVPAKFPASDVYEWAKQPKKPVYSAEEVNAVPKSMKGTPGGVAELGSTGKVPASQLPVIDITTHLVDNPSKVLILGGLLAKDMQWL